LLIGIKYAMQRGRRHRMRHSVRRGSGAGGSWLGSSPCVNLEILCQTEFWLDNELALLLTSLIKLSPPPLL